MEFNDASERRDAAREFMNGPAADPVTNEPDEPDEQEQLEEERVPSAREVTEETEEAEGEEPQEQEEVVADEAGQEEAEEEVHDVEALEIDGELVQVETLEYHHRMVTDLVEALDGTPYPIDFTEDGEVLTEESVEGGMAELGARLADAHAFYSVLDGTVTMEQFFQRVNQLQGQKAHDFVVNGVLQYAQKIGLIETTEEEQGTGNMRDPVLEENKRLKQQLAERGGNEITQRTNDYQNKVFQQAVNKLVELGQGDKISDRIIKKQFVPAMAKTVGGNRAIINRIARGNFVDLVKIYDSLKNDLVDMRVEKNNSKVSRRKERDARVPRRVKSGGERPSATASKATYDLATSDGRRAAAKAALAK